LHSFASYICYSINKYFTLLISNTMKSPMSPLVRRSILLFSFAFLLFLGYTKASHIVGSDISYKCTSTPGVFNVTVKLYRDCGGIQLCANCPTSLSPSCTIPINITGAANTPGDGMPTSSCSGTSFGSTNLAVISAISAFDAIQLCGLEKSICSNCGTRTPGSFTPGVEVYTFEGDINLSAIPISCCLVSINYSSCCRNSAITTLTSPASKNYYSEAIINRCATPCNASPTFTNDPVIVTCSGQDFYYNLGAIDPDGDSLSYKFGAALGATNSPLPYESPYSPTVPLPYLGAPMQSPPALPPVGISLDPVSGDIRFMPTGQFVAMLIIEVKQWKKIGGIYTLMGITRRDIQFYTKFCPNNNIPVVKTYNNDGTISSPQSNFNYAVCAGQQLCFMISAQDNTSTTDTTDISWNAPALMVNTGATFTKCYNPATRDSIGPKYDSVRFCWTPPANLQSNLPYYFVVKANDRACPIPARNTRSFSIFVGGTPNAKINKINKGCGTYDINYTMQNNVPLNLSYTKFLVETAPGASTYQTYNSNAVSNHYFATPGWHRIQLQIATSTPNNGACTNHNIWDSIFVTPHLKVSINDTFNCTNNPVYVQAKGTGGTSFGNSYRYTFYKGNINSTQIYRAFGPDSICFILPTLVDSTSYYKVVISDLYGCKDSTVFRVFTKQNINVNITSLGATTFCMGDSVKIQASNSSSYSYYWFRDNNLLPNENSSFIYAKSTGKYEAAILDTSGCMATPDSVYITVNPIPTASISPSDSASICVGSNQIILANNDIGLSYQWYVNDTIISGQTLRTLTTNKAGMYKVKTTNTFGCMASSSPLHLVVNSNPVAGVITGPTTGLATGITYSYSVSSQAGHAYYWLIGNGTILSGQGTNAVTVTWTNPGTCILLVGVKNSVNCADSASLNMSIGNPTPAILYFIPDSARSNETVVIFGTNLLGANAVKLGGVNVQSYTVVSLNQINAVVGAGASGVVEVETPQGIAQKAGFTYISSTGIGSLSGTMPLSVYPNPVRNELVICCLDKREAIISVVVTDMLGRVLAEPKQIWDGNTIEVSTQNLSPGTYILCIQKGNDLSRLKFVKEN
jgi:hypothetical protein